MTDRHSLIAFMGCLLTIVILAICGTVAVNNGKDGSVYVASITGLIGVIGTFRPRSPASAETKTGDINVEQPS